MGVAFLDEQDGGADYLRLREWHPQTKQYTGREMIVEVTWMLTEPMFGVQPGYACLAIRRANGQRTIGCGDADG